MLLFVILITVGVSGVGTGIGTATGDPPDWNVQTAATEITKCMDITNPGEYKLTDNLSNQERCIEITADDVVLDGAGHTVTGINSGNRTSGVYITGDNVTVIDLTVEGWSEFNDAGIRFHATSGGEVLDVTATGNYHGVLLDGAGDIEVRNVTASGNVDIGITIWESSNNTVTGNTVINTSGISGIYLDGDQANSNNNIITDNELRGNDQHGIDVRGSEGNEFTDNTLTGNGDTAINVINSNDGEVSNNTMIANGRHGIFLDGSSMITIRNNTATNNTISGIDLAHSTNNTLAGNTLTDNGGHGIWLTNSTRNDIGNNIATGNTEPGITIWNGSDNNTVKDNVATNNRKQGLSIGGETIGSDNNDVHRNTLNENDDAGISLELSDGNEFVDNTVTDNGGYGVLIDGSSSNTFRNTTVTGNGDDAVRIRAGSKDTVVEKLDLGDSTTTNTTISFEGREIHVDSVAAADVNTNPDAEPIDRYFTANRGAAFAFINVDLHYTEGDIKGVDEGTLALWQHDGTEWSKLDSSRNTTGMVVSANLTDFGTIGAFGEIPTEITFEDQEMENGSSTVVIASAITDVEFYVNVTNEDGDVLGTTKTFDAGEQQTGFDVKLDENLTADQTLTASVHDASDDSELANDTADITVTRSTQSIDEAVDQNGDDQIGLTEIQQAIRWWANNEAVPNTGGKTIGITKIQSLIQKWASD